MSRRHLWRLPLELDSRAAWSRTLSIAIGLGFALPARAQIAVGGVVSNHPEVAEALSRKTGGGTFMVVGSGRDLPGVQLGSRLFAIPRERLRGAIQSMTSEVDSPRLFWSAPRRLLLDQVGTWVRRDEYVEQFEALGEVPATGRGVLIGIADSGLDFEHPDLQNPDGTTRVEWLLDFSMPPLGIHADLEAEYGCDVGEEFSCGILSAKEIDSLLSGNRLLSPDAGEVNLPTDRLGHGTHVTSIAAGNGAANPRYVGVAPEAGLIVAKIASTETSVSDAGVLMATRFIYDRADDLGRPVVVNLSLGGDFGPHDGSSGIAKTLEEMVEPPGHALVVAAGNSGSLYSERGSSYPGPLGIHTEVAIPAKSSTRVPLIFPQLGVELSGLVLIWIGSERGDSIAVGLEDAQGNELVEPIIPGYAAVQEYDGVEAIVINRVDSDEEPEFEDLQYGAAVLLEGDFASGRVLALRLEGKGTASVWVQSEGQLRPAFGSEGVLVPGATRVGTITIPASSPGLIAVGATVNRISWPARSGGKSTLVDVGTEFARSPNSAAFFSSHGPSTGGWMKPDILAPGVALVAAMSSAADPDLGGRRNPFSIFNDSGVCPESSECAVVSDEYAVSLGTSMSAPVVAGAAALLLEQDPALTQAEVRRYLQAGSHRLPDDYAASIQAEPGQLDLGGSARSLAIDQDRVDPEPPSSRHSWLAVSDELARPDPKWPLTLRLHLRDAAGQLAHSRVGDIDLKLENGVVLDAPRVPAPGLIEARVAARPSSAGRELRVRFERKGELLATRELPIAIDKHVEERGLSVRGGCAAVGVAPGPASGAWWLLALLGWALQRRSAKYKV